MNTLQIQSSVGGESAPVAEVAQALPVARRATTSAPDAFGRAAGPDAEIAFVKQTMRVFAHFEVDPETKEMKVSVVDEAGKLVRLIPADSVRQMIAAMAAYSRR